MSRKVYLGRLNDKVREKDVDRFFKGFHVRSVILKSGYGFVEFDDARDAEDAVYDLNGRELCGDRIIVEHARGPSRRGAPGGGGGYYGGSSSRDRDRGDPKPVWLDKYGPPVRTPYRVVVENLSSRVSWQDLKDYLRQAGEVTYADAHKEKKNQGIVEFATYADMKNVITKLDDTEINGRRIHIIEQKSKERRRSPSDSRSRSRSPRSRSRDRSPSDRRRKSPSRSRSRHSDDRRSHSASRSPEPRAKDGSNDRRSRSRSNASD